MRALVLAGSAFVAAFIQAMPAYAAERMQFWNLTSSTLTSVTLAPVGSTDFGPNQCANDKDGTVDHDERLRLTGVTPGHYDVQVTTKRGQSCLVRDVTVSGQGRYAFSLSDEDLTNCHAVETR